MEGAMTHEEIEEELSILAGKSLRNYFKAVSGLREHCRNYVYIDYDWHTGELIIFPATTMET